MERLLIDTDTASDDAVALVMACQSPVHHIEAITVVAGNVNVDQGVQNAIYTSRLCGKDIPVYRGAAKPLVRPLDTAEGVHGKDGMGDIGLPLKGQNPAPGHAVDVIVELIQANPGKINLVTLGPLTNIALALLKTPEIASQVKSAVVMGGTGQGAGNVTPVAEYNIWVDPDAAKIVFASGMPITMVGWDISKAYALFEKPDIDRVRSIGTPLARFCMDIQAGAYTFYKQHYDVDGFSLPDPIAMAVALDRGIVTHAPHLFVDVEAQSELCRGQTVVDHHRSTEQPPNTEVVLEVSRQGFLDMLDQAIR